MTQGAILTRSIHRLELHPPIHLRPHGHPDDLSAHPDTRQDDNMGRRTTTKVHGEERDELQLDPFPR